MKIYINASQNKFKCGETTSMLIHTNTNSAHSHSIASLDISMPAHSHSPLGCDNTPKTMFIAKTS